MNEHDYLYALTWANCPLADFGLGVDPRFAVELVGYGQLAAVTSRVGWDQVDLAKLQEGTVDVQWMSKVAVRHNEIIGVLARHVPVLPMRLGILFESQSSLIAKLTSCEADTAKFLRYLADRQEWAVKIYVDEDRAEKAILSHPPARSSGRRDPPHQATVASRGVKDVRPHDPCTPDGEVPNLARRQAAEEEPSTSLRRDCNWVAVDRSMPWSGRPRRPSKLT